MRATVVDVSRVVVFNHRHGTTLVLLSVFSTVLEAIRKLRMLISKGQQQRFCYGMSAGDGT
jgi:hypothetical protein